MNDQIQIWHEFFQDTDEVNILQLEDSSFWFQFSHLCKVFGYTNPTVALQTHCEDYEIKKLDIGQHEDVNFVSESGFYSLALGSRKPKAKKFKKWVCTDVLPKLRASGGYIMPSATSEQLEALQAEIAALQKDKEELAGKVYYMEFGDAPDESFDSFEYTVYKNARNFYRYASAYESLTPRQKDAITDECDKKFPHPRVALQDKKSRKKYVEGNGLSLVKRW